MTAKTRCSSCDQDATTYTPVSPGPLCADCATWRHPQQPREHAVPCRNARPGDTRHTTWNPSAICDNCQART